MKHLPRLPDLLTTANLTCGAASILLASQGHLAIACWLIFAAAIFDVFDGLAARALGGGTPLGVQLDSLADMVSFGAAPAFLLWTSAMAIQPTGLWWAAAAAVWICVASGWRLAKFNVDTRQSSGFLGLPTPANGLFWASMVLASGNSGSHFRGMIDFPAEWIHGVFTLPVLLFTIALVLGLLMLSELPLPSLKFKHGGWKGNEVVFLLIGIGIALALLYGILAVPLLLILYLLSPFWGRFFPKTT